MKNLNIASTFAGILACEAGAARSGIEQNYIRKTLASQLHLTADKSKFVPMKESEARQRYEFVQKTVNGGEFVPSQQVIAEAVLKSGQDYRVETQGPHPIELLRDRKALPTEQELLQYALSK